MATVERVPWTDEAGELVEFAAAWMAPYLHVFRETMDATQAAAAAGVAYRTVSYARSRDPVFAGCFADVVAANVARLEGSAFRDAVSGKDPVGRIFLLKSWAPDRYSDRLELRHSGTVEHSLEITGGVDPITLDPAARHAAARLLQGEDPVIEGTAEDA